MKKLLKKLRRKWHRDIMEQGFEEIKKQLRGLPSGGGNPTFFRGVYFSNGIGEGFFYFGRPRIAKAALGEGI